CLQLTSAHLQGSVSILRRNRRSHFGQRLDDAPHGSARKRVIADQFALKGLACKYAGEHTHSRSGVATIERSSWFFQRAATSVDCYSAIVSFDSSTQRSHAGERAGAIGSGRKIAQARGSFSQRAQHSVSMRNAFIAGQTN